MYSNSLKEEIEDGFLAAYKAVEVHFDRDVQGYRPGSEKRDIFVTKSKIVFITQETRPCLRNVMWGGYGFI